ncbi:PucR family transcriptional regulator [Loigolactobacillus binensis]|uniref:PucR family transcriptional regulator n=1 Tax=Loigolactobacillus binensis TaxID=2559922 RepID=A0ABW3EFJ0_9LACO|nr:helix-turn-helix domain-containing protein [Loigolactobacillus binensis]
MATKSSGEIFFDAVYEGTDTAKLINLAYELLNNPIMVTDETFHALCLKRDKPVNDPVWLDVEQKGYCSEDYVLSFRADPVSTMLFQQTQAIIYKTGLAIKMPRILCRINNREKTLGYVILFAAERKLVEDDRLVVMNLAKALSLILRGKGGLTQMNNSRDIALLLRDLILKPAISPEELAEKKRALPHLKTYFQVVVLDSIQKRYVAYLERSITSILNVLCVLHASDDQLIIVINTDTAITDLTNIERICTKYAITAGISWKFKNLALARDYYNQACRAIDFGLSGQLNDYDHYYLLHILSYIPTPLLNTMIYPSYRKLREYDIKNASSYCQTLINYFETGLSVNETANRLHIHRNTMKYRIDKAEVIGECDLNDENTLLKIYLSSLIYACLEQGQLKLNIGHG